MDVRKVGLGVVASGALLQVGGFVIDGRLHAADPTLAGREGVFTLTNLGHLLVYLGLAAIFVGVVAAFAGPRLYRPTGPSQIGRRLAQLSAPLAAMALIGGVGVGANASSLGAVHQHDHGTMAAGEVHADGDHDHVAEHAGHADDAGHTDGADHADHDGDDTMDHGDDGSTDHGHGDGATETAGGDHGSTGGHTSSGGHTSAGHADTVSFGGAHGDDDHGTDGGADAHGDDHGDHDTTDTTTGHGDGHDHDSTTSTTPGNTGTTHPHDHGSTTTTPGNTGTTQPHDHGSTTTTPGNTGTTQPHDHGSTTTTPGHTTTTHDHHPTTTVPGTDCTNGGHGDDHHGPVELDLVTQAEQDIQLAQAKAYAQEYPTAASAMNAGYTQVTHYLCGIGAHYMKISWVDEVFNPAEPEILLYDGDGPFAELVGVNYYVGRSSGVAPDGFAGPNDQWHQHFGLCLKLFFVIGPGSWTEEECTAAGGVKQADGGYYWLLHAWVVDGYEMPDNIFSPFNPVLPPGPWDFPGESL